MGSEHIKITEMIRTRNKVFLKHAVKIKTPDNTIHDGKLIDIDGLKKVIGKAIEKHQIKTKEVVFSISSTRIITREVELPKVSKNKLKALIQVNVQEYFPVNLDEYIVDYAIVDTIHNKQEKKYKVQLVAALSSHVESYVELTDHLGLRLHSIDYVGNSLAHFIQQEQLKESAMVIDLGSETTQVAFIAEQKIQLLRNMPYGVSAVVEKVTAIRDVTYEQASQLLCEEALITLEDDSNAYLPNTVSSPLNQVLNGVSRVLDYFSTRHSDKINNIYLLGGGSKLCGIEEYIEKYFNIKTQTFEKMSQLESKELESTEINSFFHICIGGAYSKINLLPHTVRKKSQKKNKLRLLIELGILLGLSSVLFVTYQLNHISHMKHEKKVLMEQIEAAHEVAVLMESTKVLSEQLEFLKGISASSDNTSLEMLSIIEAIEKQMPENIFFKSLNHSNEQLMLNCVAKDKMTVARFIQSIKDLPYFRSVYVPAIIEEVDNNQEVHYSFTMRCDFCKGE